MVLVLSVTSSTPAPAHPLSHCSNVGGYTCGKNRVYTIWHPTPCPSRLKTPYFVATDKFIGRGHKTAEEWDKLPAMEKRGVCTGESLYRVPD